MSPPAPSPLQGHALSNALPNALPVGTRLRQFEILSVLGAGGFGIVYLAMDHALEREVAVKEYMPSDLAGRTETLHVSIRSQSDAEIFHLGRDSFVKEAKMLARFEHPSLLKVYHFWEDNGTAYMAMPVLRGQTIKALRRSMHQPPDEAWLRPMLESLLGAIETLHAQEIYHRDIAPDNIQIEPDGRPVLMDFGAARRVLGDKTTIVTTIVKPTYSPIEQFAETGASRQGPWTDIYALGGTLHFLLLNRPPAPATARMVYDDESALTVQALPGCSAEFLRIVDWMLAPHPGDRPQSVAVLRQALAGRLPVPLRRSMARQESGEWEKTVLMPPPDGRTVISSAPVTPTAPPTAQAQPLYNDNDAVTMRVPPPSAREQPSPAVPRTLVAPGATTKSSKALPIVLGLGAVAVAGAVVLGLNRRPATPTAEAPAASAPAEAAVRALPSAPTLSGATAALSALETAASAPAPSVAGAPVAPAAKADSPAGSAMPPLVRPDAAAAKALPPPASKPPPVGKPAVNPRPGAAVGGAALAAPPAAAAVAEPVQRAAEPPPPAAAQQPVPPSKPAATNPEAVCAGRSALSTFVCMDKECRKSEQVGTADCKKWHQNARNPNE